MDEGKKKDHQHLRAMKPQIHLLGNNHLLLQINFHSCHKHINDQDIPLYDSRNISVESARSNNEKAKEYFYRMNFADEYTSDQGLTVTKFERDTYKRGDEKWNASGSGIVYTFIRSFPISITSMPVSYDSSNLLKCTVSMSYIRYVVERLSDTPATQSPNSESRTTPFNVNNLTQQFLDQNGNFNLRSQFLA